MVTMSQRLMSMPRSQRFPQAELLGRTENCSYITLYKKCIFKRMSEELERFLLLVSVGILSGVKNKENKESKE